MTNALNAVFFESLGALQLLFFWIAVFASLFLLVGIITMFVPALFLLKNAEKYPFVTAKTVCSFLCVGGWCGFVSSLYLDNVWTPVLIFLVTGACAFAGAGFLFRALAKARFSSFKKHCAGADAVVLVTVPPQRKGHGLIAVFQDNKAENLRAVTDESEAIPVNTPVKILSYSDDYALVTRLEKTKIGNPDAQLQPKIQPETQAELHSRRFFRKRGR